MKGKLLQHWPAFGLGLLGGALLTILIRSSGDASSHMDVGEVVERRAPLTRSEGAVREKPASAVLAKLKEDPEQKENIPQMNDSDLQSTIIAMLNEADPFKGFSYKEKSLFNTILDELAKRDPDGALDWVDGHLSGALRTYAYERLLDNRFADDQPREAIDFYESRGFSLDEISRYAGKLMLSTKDLSSADAIHLLKKSFNTGRSSSGSSANFAEGFDFAAFAEEAIRLKLQDTEGKMNFARFPSNLFVDWVKSDPHGAMEFYNQHYLGEEPVKLNFNGLEELAEGYLATASRESSKTWTTEILTNSEIPLHERKSLVSFLLEPRSEHGEFLAYAGSAITDREQAIEYSSMVLDSAVSKSLQTYSMALSLFPDGESRLAHIETLAEQGGYTIRQLRERSARLYDDLSALGHSDAEIQRVATAIEEGQ